MIEANGTIAFYISGHGFGHASRVIEVINALAAREPGLRIIVRTAAARWLFERTVKAAIQHHHLECDTGVVQIDSLHLDEVATIERARAFMRGFDDRVRVEADWLQREQVDLVLSDAPPLGVAAGRTAGLPTVLFGNFTWDWIYSAYPESSDLIEAIGARYALSTWALRLPMHGGFATVRGITDLPFVARRSRRDPVETRRALGLPVEERLVLVSFGGYGVERLDVEQLTTIEGYAILMSGGAPMRGIPAVLDSPRRGSLLPFDERRMYEAGFLYEDLVRACDVVITKPGYGIIAECLANDTALLYTSRGHFVEYDVLVAAMPRFLRSSFISHDDLFAGNWQPHLDGLLAQAAPPDRPAVNGADVAATLLLEMIS